MVDRTSCSVLPQYASVGLAPYPVHVEYSFCHRKGCTSTQLHQYACTPKFAGDETSALFGIFPGRDDHPASTQSLMASSLVKFVNQARVQKFKASNPTGPLFDPKSWPHLSQSEFSHCVRRAIARVHAAGEARAASFLVFHGDYLVVTNLGDAQVILGHAGDYPEEEAKLEITESYCPTTILPLSRRPASPTDPDLLVTRLTVHDQYLILASASVWDALTPEHVLSICQSSGSSVVAAQRIIEKLDWGPADATVIVLFLHATRPAGPDTTESLVGKRWNTSCTTTSTATSGTSSVTTHTTLDPLEVLEEIPSSTLQ